MHQSIATIDSPEFLNLQPLDINPLMSKCEIKVLYVGENRNHTFITKEVATQIGKTLRGAPIVGYYKESKEDFSDHGEKIIIDDEGIKFQCQTFPYGFVAPDSKVWFQNFEDIDINGQSIVHTYLMATGYLWTEQFPESSLPVKEGRPQSMELKPDSVQGQWKRNFSTGIDFFIINDAIIQKICILGDDVEPCFEGASVTSPDVSTHFMLDNKFKYTLYSMIQDLKNTLNEGSQQMENLENIVTDENKIQDTSIPTDYVKKEEEEKKKDEEKTNSSDEENKDSTEKESSNSSSSKDETDNSDKKETSDEKQEDEKKKSAKKYELIEEELKNLKNQYDALRVQYQELVTFKTEIDNQKKDALIAEFYMLSDADKRDVIQNKNKYSLDEIKSKLAVVCFDKKINFTLDKENKKEEKDEVVITTYNLKNEEDSNLPEWVKAVKEQEKLG